MKTVMVLFLMLFVPLLAAGFAVELGYKSVATSFGVTAVLVLIFLPYIEDRIK